LGVFVGLGVGEGRGVFVGVAVFVAVGFSVSVGAGVDMGCTVEKLHANNIIVRINKLHTRGLILEVIIPFSFLIRPIPFWLKPNCQKPSFH
jgi:hypothetical protein